MSWNPVAALNPPVFDVPEGEPAPLMAAASVMSSIADDVRTRADAALSGFNAITGWEGPGQTAAAAMAADVVSTLHLAAGVVDAGASITRELASQIAEAKSEVNSAQNRAIELANWAATLVNPVYGLFDQVSGQAIGANDRARAAKEQAARRYGDLVEAALRTARVQGMTVRQVVTALPSDGTERVTLVLGKADPYRRDGVA